MASRLGDMTLAVEALNGMPVLLGTITATTTKNNSTTAVPFYTAAPDLSGRVLMLQADSACYVVFGATSALAVATTAGVKLAADEKFYVTLRSDTGLVACLPGSGTTVLRVYELT